jgi:hypothetical protein
MLFEVYIEKVGIESLLECVHDVSEKPIMVLFESNGILYESIELASKSEKGKVNVIVTDFGQEGPRFKVGRPSGPKKNKVKPAQNNHKDYVSFHIKKGVLSTTPEKKADAIKILGNKDYKYYCDFAERNWQYALDIYECRNDADRAKKVESLEKELVEKENEYLKKNGK